MNTIELVKEFHTKFGLAIKQNPCVTDKKVNELRIRLIAEELEELTEALEAGDVVSTFDALLDLQYVIDGAFLSLGFSSIKEVGFAEVHRSNMSKLDENGAAIIRMDGKILKSKFYSPPDLSKVL